MVDIQKYKNIAHNCILLKLMSESENYRIIFSDLFIVLELKKSHKYVLLRNTGEKNHENRICSLI